MNIERLTFFSPTSIRLPKAIYQALEQDACFFGFKKNNNPNINGFLNELIPNLADQKNDTYQQLLSKGKLSSETVDQLTNFLNFYEFCHTPVFDNELTNISFRINKSHYDDFIEIHDNLLPAFHLDFTQFIRLLLIDYTSKRLAIRERLYFYRQANNLLEACKKHIESTFYLKNESLTFIPATTVISPNTDSNLILGIDREKQKYIILPLPLVKKIRLRNFHLDDIDKKTVERLQDSLNNFLKKEEKNKFPL